MAYQQRIGAWGEEVAAQYLAAAGAELLGRNVRTAYGELDLIVKLQDMIVFIEVKTRTTDGFGWPETAVNRRKAEHLIHSAQAYLQAHVEFTEAWRIDVIAIRGKPGDHKPEITVFENAIA